MGFWIKKKINRSAIEAIFYSYLQHTTRRRLYVPISLDIIYEIYYTLYTAAL